MNTINAVDAKPWIGRELEQLRKLRGLRREDVAAQMKEPVCASTIRNIEHNERYNVSLEQLRQIAEVLGATLNVRVDLDVVANADAVDESSLQAGARVTDNEYFIRLIRSAYPNCPLTNSQIGRRIWDFAKPRGATLVKGRKQVPRIRQSEESIRLGLPTTSARFAVDEKEFVALERFADRLGRAFTDPKGRILVPLK